MLRNLAKTVFACAYRCSGTGWLRSQLLGSKPSSTPFIAGYHRVVQNFEHAARTSIPSMLISVSMFEKHIDCLARRFQFVSLDDVALHIATGRRFRRPIAAITFDDGYSDVYQNAFPILKRKGIPAALFVVTDLVGTRSAQIFDRLYLLLLRLSSAGLSPSATVSAALHSMSEPAARLVSNRPSDQKPLELMTFLLSTLPRRVVDKLADELESRIRLDRQALEDLSPVTWEMLAEMQRSGITVGSHTKSHVLLTSESADLARLELSDSKRTLESKLNAPVRHFAYPDGRFNDAVIDAVRSAGYECAYAICRSGHPFYPLLTIPRKVLWERACLNFLGRFSPTVMGCQTHWAFDNPFRCEHDHTPDRGESKRGRL